MGFIRNQVFFFVTYLGFLFSHTGLAQGAHENQRMDYAHLYHRANASLGQGDSRSAVSIFNQVIESMEAEGRTAELAESYFGIALALAFNGYYRESIGFHKKALRCHLRYRPAESSDPILLNLALTYELAGKSRKAQRIFNSL